MTAAATAAPQETTVDAFLGGRIEAVQPGRGHHRSGLEAVLLGAALPSDFSGTLADLGAGAGVAGMVAAERAPAASATLVERDPVAVECTRAALARTANRAFAKRVHIAAIDIAAGEAARAAAGIGPASMDAVITNPPFNAAAEGTVSPGIARAAAHVIAPSGLEPWFRAAASMLKPGGTLVVVFRASGLPVLLSAAAGRFGALDVLPVQPRAAEPAHRVLVRGIKGSRAPMSLLPPLVLHGETGNAYLPAVESVLRDGAGLSGIHPSWARQE